MTVWVRTASWESQSNDGFLHWGHAKIGLGFVALVIQPDELSVVHTSMVGIAHVVIGSGVWEVQLLPVQVIFYFYCIFRKGKRFIRLGLRTFSRSRKLNENMKFDGTKGNPFSLPMVTVWLRPDSNHGKEVYDHALTVSVFTCVCSSPSARTASARALRFL